ncbi:MAG TPA: hypothetical protein VGB91_08660 [Rhizomicrobium sp.]
MSEVLQPLPHRRAASLWLLWFGIAAAPGFWFAQLLLGYFLWAYRCYPGDTPIVWESSRGLLISVAMFDVVSIVVAVAGFFISYHVRQSVRDAKAHETEPTVHIGEARNRFLSTWGMLSSACFLVAILFATIASVTVPPCG